MAEGKEEKGEDKKELKNESKFVQVAHSQRFIYGVFGGAIFFLFLVFVGLGIMAVKHTVGDGRIAGNRGDFYTRNFEMPMRGSMHSGRSFEGASGLADSVSGKVTAVNDKQFTLEVNAATKTVQILDTTRFSLDSSTKVTVGDQASVIGSQDLNGIIQAERIVIK